MSLSFHSNTKLGRTLRHHACRKIYLTDIWGACTPCQPRWEVQGTECWRRQERSHYFQQWRSRYSRRSCEFFKVTWEHTTLWTQCSGLNHKFGCMGNGAHSLPFFVDIKLLLPWAHGTLHTRHFVHSLYLIKVTNAEASGKQSRRPLTLSGVKEKSPKTPSSALSDNSRLGKC